MMKPAPQKYTKIDLN